MVENKTVGADSISAHGTLPTAGRAHIAMLCPYGGRGISSGAPAPRSTTFIMDYVLFIICNR